MKIDKGVPFLEEVTHLGSINHRIKKDKIYHTIWKMEIGDSVFFKDPAAANKFRSRCDSYYRYGRFDSRFVLRRVIGGFRIWRVEDKKRDPNSYFTLD